jgi:hypothetical protein
MVTFHALPLKALIMNKKPFIKILFYVSSFSLLQLSACQSQSNSSDQSSNVIQQEIPPQNFELSKNQTKFEISQNNGKVIFGGDIFLKNSSGYSISDLSFHTVTVEITYADGDSTSFDMLCLYSKKRWADNSTAKITMGIDPFKDVIYLSTDDFKRTPEKAYLNISLTAINIDKEIPFDYQIDLIPAWKAFQSEQGLR